MTTEGLRAKRVAESVRAHLTRTLADKIEDPQLTGVVVTHVGLSDDLGIAWVFVRVMTHDEDPRVRRDVMRALRRATGRLKRGLGGAVRLKRLPELRFEYDEGHDRARRVEELLAEIAVEQGEGRDALADGESGED